MDARQKGPGEATAFETPRRRGDPTPDASDGGPARLVLGGRCCLAVPADDVDAGRYQLALDKLAVAGRLRIDGRDYLVYYLSGAAGTPASDDQPSLTDILTRRELQIAVLVAKGKVNKQIAFQLKISEYTVSTHLRRIFCKLGVSSRAAMVAHLMESTPLHVDLHDSR